MLEQMPHFSRVFFVVILLPSLVLAVMAVNLAREERVLVEHQQTMIYQTITDALAGNINRELDNIRSEFINQSKLIFDQSSPAQQTLPSNFDREIRDRWPLAEVGFLIETGRLGGTDTTNSGTKSFLAQNASFLNNQQDASIYAANGQLFQNAQFQSANQNEAQNSIDLNSLSQNQQQLESSPQTNRSVSPQRVYQSVQSKLTSVTSTDSTFEKAVAHENSGIIARFLDNKLQLLVWSRLGGDDSRRIAGAEMNLGKLTARLGELIQTSSGSKDDADPGYCMALIDDKGQPMAISKEGFKTEWTRPFVSSQIGGALPHWEVALYLTQPDEIKKSARFLQLVLCCVVMVMFVAIATGGMFIANDVRRQLNLAQQKTDFVSNVSHELKTPLTSIRMFSELLAEDRVADQQKRLTYLRIIAAEAGRLTRLINNVLDFSRPDRRNQEKISSSVNLVEVVREVEEMNRPHLESVNIRFNVELPNHSVYVLGDRDGMAQVLLNLVSNAEKYGGGEIEVRAFTAERTLKVGAKMSSGEHAVVEVLDRGAGVPSKQAESIFQPFVRLNDSLSSGIPGTGLGLTLARRLARENGGEVTYQDRAGGGACFEMILPLDMARMEMERREKREVQNQPVETHKLVGQPK